MIPSTYTPAEFSHWIEDLRDIQRKRRRRDGYVDAFNPAAS